MKVRTNALHNGADLSTSAASARLNSQGLISAALAATVASISTAQPSSTFAAAPSSSSASTFAFTTAPATNSTPTAAGAPTISTPRPRPGGLMGHADGMAGQRDRTHLALDPSKRRSHTTAAVGIDSQLIDTDSPLPKDVLELVRSITAKDQARANDLSPSLQRLINAAAANSLTPQAVAPNGLGHAPPLHRPNQINNELLETPTPTKIIFPKQVTDAQAEFADGFQQALRQVQIQNSFAPTPSLNSPSTVNLLSLIAALQSPGFGSNLNSPVNGQPFSILDPLFAQKLALQQQQQQQTQLSPSSHSTSTAATLSPLSSSDQSIASLSAANLVVGGSSGVANSLHVPPKNAGVLPTVVSTAPTPPPPSLLAQVPNGVLPPPQPPITTAALPSSIASSLLNDANTKLDANGSQGYSDLFQPQAEMTNAAQFAPFIAGGPSGGMLPAHMPQQPPPQQSAHLPPASMAQRLPNGMEIKSEPHDPPMSQGGYSMASSSALHVSVHQQPMSCGASSAYSVASSRGESFDMNDQEQRKLQRKRERNRLAASKCRQRKIDKIEELERALHEEQKQTSKLRQDKERLERELEHYRALTKQHEQKGCLFSAANGTSGAN
ncbi:BMA-JUN-1, isoform a [Aphelenchoides fujianensis]|nr:BMA-JUN-1, isoform a [Aphelenchoides fujianensis]